MTDYQRLYYLLFNKITDVIAELQQLQQEAEALYIADGLPSLTLLPPEPPKPPEPPEPGDE